jgi:hypothetical protein
MVSLGLLQTPMTGEALPPTSSWVVPAAIEPLAALQLNDRPVNQAAILKSSISPVVAPAASPFAQPMLRIERASFQGR